MQTSADIILYPTLQPVPDGRREELFPSHPFPDGEGKGEPLPHYLKLRAETEDLVPLPNAVFNLISPVTGQVVASVKTDHEGLAFYAVAGPLTALLKYMPTDPDRILPDSTGKFVDLSRDCEILAVFRPSATLVLNFVDYSVSLYDRIITDAAGTIHLRGAESGMEVTRDFGPSEVITVAGLYPDAYHIRVDADGFMDHETLLPRLTWGDTSQHKVGICKICRLKIVSYDMKARRYVQNLDYYLLKANSEGTVEKTGFDEDGNALFTLTKDGEYRLRVRSLPRGLNEASLISVGPIYAKPGESLDITVKYRDSPYDAQCKLILSHPQVLARLVRLTHPRFKDMKIDEIVPLINSRGTRIIPDSELIFPREQVDPAMVATFGYPFPSPLPTENVSMEEGKILYDLSTTILVPQSSGGYELENLIVESEMDDGHILRDVVPRNAVYLGRKASSQVMIKSSSVCYENVKRTNIVWFFPRPSINLRKNRVVDLPVEGIQRSFENEIRNMVTFTLKEDEGNETGPVRKKIESDIYLFVHQRVSEKLGQMTTEAKKAEIANLIVSNIAKEIVSFTTSFSYGKAEEEYVHKIAEGFLGEQLPKIVLALYSHNLTASGGSGTMQSPFADACKNAVEQIQKHSFANSYRQDLLAEVKEICEAVPCEIEKSLTEFIVNGMKDGFRTEFGYMDDYFHSTDVFLGDSADAASDDEAFLCLLFHDQKEPEERVKILENKYQFKIVDFPKKLPRPDPRSVISDLNS